MFKYETHMHTYPASACASSTPEEMVRFYKNMDYTGAIVTDHFFNGNSGCPKNISWVEKVKFFAEGYFRAKKEGDMCDLDVFFGLEYSFSGTDFLVYGVTPDWLLEHPGFDKLSLGEFSATVRAAGAYLAQAHPFRDAFWIANPSPADPSLIDGIEVYNASMPDRANKKALAYAEKYGLAKQAGSDAHDNYLRRPSGILLNYRAKDIFDIIAALTTGQVNLL
ncbi:MAG: PHP domain-containing protein [Defluviitaleaceae bacterium]|nr:PHP domain-containing protein [Defluviitaleaceae bacterium]